MFNKISTKIPKTVHMNLTKPGDYSMQCATDFDCTVGSIRSFAKALHPSSMSSLNDI